MVWLLVLVLVSVSYSAACPLWHIYDSTSGECQCGADLGGVISCANDTSLIALKNCYCLSYSEHFNKTVVGPCISTCNSPHNEWHDWLEEKQLNAKVCEQFERDGQLCGRCADGYGPPVYAYSLQCVECSKSDFTTNLLKYMAVAFLPLTVFYLGAVMFKLSVTSGKMVAYILICQVISVPSVQRVYRLSSGILVNFLIAIYSVWNLDFFRPYYTPFCIHPKLSTLHVLALDYLVGVYPLFLIFLTYIAVTLHDRYPIVVKIWRPAYRVFMCIRREWNIRGSLIQAFATFLVLSYVKILNVSFDLLTPVYLKTAEGETLNETYLYNAGELVYFGSEHLPFGLLAVLMLTVFNILPAVLLLLYPCRWFRKCLSCCRMNSHTLHTFMHAFQGCYRHTPRDCRYFAALYLLFRILNIYIFAIFTFFTSWSISGVLFILLSYAIIFVAPYRDTKHNKIEPALFLFLTSIFPLTYLSASKEMDINWQFHMVLSVLCAVVVCSPLAFSIVLLVHKLLPAKFQSSLKGCCYAFCSRRKSTVQEIVEDRWFLSRQEAENEISPALLP